MKALAIILVVCIWPQIHSRGADPKWFVAPISISGLPPNSTSVPVTCRIDFTSLLRELNIPGVVDERLIRLFKADSGKKTEVAPQLIPEPQRRPDKRQLLPGTPSSVSYLGEFAPGETSTNLRVAGELTWIASADETGRSQYELHFGIPTEGRMVQVPYPPQNLRGFDPSSRATPVRWFPKMRLSPQWPFEGKVNLYEARDLITTYLIGPSPTATNPLLRRPFFYPLHDPDGYPLTEFGKPHDPTGSHAHHYSVWIAHVDVNGQNFWGEKGGIIAHENFELMEDGPVFSRLVQKLKWLNQGEPLLHEKRTITTYEKSSDFRLIDLELEFSSATQQPVTFGKTSFGFLAVRVAQSMTVFDGAGEIRNSNGDLNEQNAHLKRARWIDQSGPVTQDRWSGIAILDHPSNPNHPTGFHCRNDGWAGASFNMESPFTLQPNASLKLRYRLHLHRGDALKAEVQKRFDEYAAKPSIEFGKTAAAAPPAN